MAAPFRLAFAAAALALLAGPALAQKGAPSPLDEGFGLCTSGADGIDGARAALTAAGWTIDDEGEYGPYQAYISASKTNPKAGDRYFYLTFETYPTIDLSYCTFEISGTVPAIDIPRFAAANQLDHDVEVRPDGTYATFEHRGDDSGTIFLVESQSDYFYLQLNRLAPSDEGGM